MEIDLADAFSLNEAGFLTGLSTAAINRAIDREELDTSSAARAADGSRRLGRAELRTLAVIGAVGKDLTPAARRKVSEAMRRLPVEGRRVGLGIMEVKLDDLDKCITERLFRLEALRRLVEPQTDDDPLIRGTRFSAHAVAALARGQTTAETIEDCPGLTPESIAAAVKYVEVYPRAGRPLATRSLKRVLSDMATSGVWDIETDDEPLVP